MLGRVIMAFGHRALHFVQHTLYYLPEPFGVALRAPVSVRHQWASPQHSSSKLVLCIRLAPLVGREHFVVITDLER